MNGSATGRRRVAIDFSAIKTGGGVQRALTFLQSLAVEPWPDADIFLVLPPSGALSKLVPAIPADSVHAPAGLLARAWFEYVVWPATLRSRRIEAVLTFFGAGLPHPPHVRSVVGVAYPIICYPDSPFWRFLPAVAGVRQRIKNLARVLRLRSASLVVAETEIMAGRLSRTLAMDRERITVIMPTPTCHVDDSRDTQPRPFTFLFLSGLSPHKNLWRLPEVARAVREQVQQPFVFLVSVHREAFEFALPPGVGVDDDLIKCCFDFAGPVPESEVGEIYRRTDVVVNLSDLESFSNNYMEAWRAGLPQIASDRDFARSICGNSAWYVEPHDVEAVARAMVLAMTDGAGRQRLALEGRRRLDALPSQAEATRWLGSLVLDGSVCQASRPI